MDLVKRGMLLLPNASVYEFPSRINQSLARQRGSESDGLHTKSKAIFGGAPNELRNPANFLKNKGLSSKVRVETHRGGARIKSISLLIPIFRTSNGEVQKLIATSDLLLGNLAVATSGGWAWVSSDNAGHRPAICLSSEFQLSERL